jgi:feruloyl esterase
MSPATNSRGEVREGWNYYGIGQPGRPPRLANRDLPGEFERYFVDEKVRNVADTATFDFDHEPATFARSRRIYDALSADLGPLKSRGAKMLMWHGWADSAIMATSSIGYYESVVKFMGGRKQTEDFFRLFPIPGFIMEAEVPDTPFSTR